MLTGRWWMTTAYTHINPKGHPEQGQGDKACVQDHITVNNLPVTCICTSVRCAQPFILCLPSFLWFFALFFKFLSLILFYYCFTATPSLAHSGSVHWKQTLTDAHREVLAAVCFAFLWPFSETEQRLNGMKNFLLLWGSAAILFCLQSNHESTTPFLFWLGFFKVILNDQCPVCSYVQVYQLTSSFQEVLAGCPRALACGTRTTWLLGLWNCCSWSRGDAATFWFAAGRCRPLGSRQIEVRGENCHPQSSLNSEKEEEKTERKKAERQRSETTEHENYWTWKHLICKLQNPF